MTKLVVLSIICIAATAWADKPPQEFADFSKAMTGSWKCTGTGENDGKQVDLKATVTHKADGLWLRSSFTAKTAKGTLKFDAMTSYDAASKKMWRVHTYPDGGHVTMTAPWGDGKLSWEGDGHWASKGDVKVRETEELKGKELHLVGEYSTDGKTWNKDHDVTCKK